MKVLINFIPIITIFLLVTYTDEMAKWSHTILGKLFAVFLIIFYTIIDNVLGLFICALVVFYYQSDYIEGFNEDFNEGFNEGFNEEFNEDLNEGFNEELNEELNEESQEKNTESFVINEDFSCINKNKIALVDAYPNSPTEHIIHDPKVNRFRQDHCSKGHLMHKGQIVKPEMAEHVFPQIKQGSFHKCNICDPVCDFDFINEKNKVYDDIMKPKSSNDFVDIVWRNMKMDLQ